MSKCFETIIEDDISPVERTDAEVTRQYAENWDSTFTTPERYANYKLKILQNDMYIKLTWDEKVRMRNCTSQAAIDAMFRGLIEKYWG